MRAVARRVARIWKRGGGYFERVRRVQTTLTRNFIDVDLRRNVSESSEIQSFFRPKLGDLQKKKKKGLRQN